jgi:hypothetical protein
MQAQLRSLICKYANQRLDFVKQQNYEAACVCRDIESDLRQLLSAVDCPGSAAPSAADPQPTPSNQETQGG